jgi:hypothetical protein
MREGNQVELVIPSEVEGPRGCIERVAAGSLDVARDDKQNRRELYARPIYAPVRVSILIVSPS